MTAPVVNPDAPFFGLVLEVEAAWRELCARDHAEGRYVGPWHPWQTRETT